MDNKIRLALNDLHDVIISKIEEIKRLEKKITELSINNAKLQDEITNLVNSSKKDRHQKDNIKEVVLRNEMKQDYDKKLINEDASEDIDISINQLKSIISKKSK